ncbi:MAG: FlgD immunoglobulin-like domain containing protein [bacterium]
MRRSYYNLMEVKVLLMLILGMSMPAVSQTINVTFQLNTSTNPDTLKGAHFVQVRGAVNGQTGAVLPGGKTITWDAGSQLLLQNTGGDYWNITFQMNADDTLRYKFWTGYTAATGTFFNTGWEGNLDATNGLPGGDRAFVSGSTDTTVDLQYYNGDGSNKAQFWRPFVSKPDSMAIFFRVNMGGVTEQAKFNPNVNGPISVRGNDATSGGVLTWDAGTKVTLTRETNSVDNGSFWSGVAYIPHGAISIPSRQAYKFFVNNAGGIDWEGGNDREFFYSPSKNDTTLSWVYFDRVVPTGKVPVQSVVTFRVNLASLEGVGLFDLAKGDEVKVIGAKGWDRPANYIDMVFNPLLQEWTASEPFNVIPATPVNYKYFIIWDSTRTQSGHPNYVPQLSLDDGWEEPGVVGGGNRVFAYANAPQQSVPGDFGRDQQFFDSVLPEGVISTPITVTWNIDMRPAADRATNPVNTLFRVGVDTAFIFLDTPLFAVTQGRRPGSSGRFRLEDANGDGIYSGTYELMTPTWFQVPFVVGYSTAAGSYVQNGGGFDKGRRYYQFIQPASISPSGPTWPSAYSFPTLLWKENNLDVEDPPALITSVADRDPGMPVDFALEQNYPNPFNPETTVKYQLARPTKVQIGIYNSVGQLVKMLIDEWQVAGDHKVVWQGNDSFGRGVASGIYYMRMTADGFKDVRKMALIR